MTEVPEHLLQRSRARRAALGLGGDAGDAPAAAPAAAAPATTEAATPAVAATPAAPAAPVAPPPPERLAPYVEAATTRKKIPFFVIPVLVILPVWALMYALTLDEPSATQAGPLTEGATVYASCAGCHGGSGDGGVGPAMSGGAVVEQFPEPGDHLHWVMEGSDGFKALGLNTYGAGEVSIKGGMPGWKSLTAEELIAVVRHERETIGGEEVDETILEASYENMMEMVRENYPDREEEFQTVVDEFAELPADS